MSIFSALGDKSLIRTDRPNRSSARFAIDSWADLLSEVASCDPHLLTDIE